MKKLLCPIVALLMIIGLTGCGQIQQPAPVPTAVAAETPAAATMTPNPTPEPKIDNSKTAIVMMTQEYAEDVIVEIPMIKYEPDPAAFPETGGKNPQIEMINDDISNGIQQIYSQFVNSESAHDGIEIMTFPFMDERYIQIIVTHIPIPPGEKKASIWSYIFDKQENRYITLGDTLNALSLTEAAVEDRAKELFVTADGSAIESARPAGLFITQEPDPEPMLFLEAWVVSEENGMPWSTWLYYDPAQDALFEFYPLTDFDPENWPQMVKMDPPLYYESYDRSAGGEYLTLVFDTQGLEEIVPGADYMFEDKALYQIAYGNTEESTEEAVLESIERINRSLVEIKSIEVDEATSMRLTYPAWRVEYTARMGEELAYCIDIYVQTDSGDICFHVTMEDKLKNKPLEEVEARIATLEIASYAG